MSDFYFNNTSLEFGAPFERAERNADAIKLSKTLIAEAREADPEELEILSNYIGWGDSRVAKYLPKLANILTEEEMRYASASSLNAHYTSLTVVDAIWMALVNLGLGGRRIRALDPSAGIGHFKSMTPPELHDLIDWTEIELDSLTAGILKNLHPGSRVLNMGFEEANLPGGMFDLAISNVPFGNYGIFSKKDLPKAAKRSIHDFFFCNTYSLLRPGGIMAYITSRFTMDKKDATVRKWLAERFNLISAVRLPDNAFKENAGAEVVTDILILQKRTKMATGIARWEKVGAYKDPEISYRAGAVNQYFLDYPDRVMGTPSMGSRMYQSDGYVVKLEDKWDLGAMLRDKYSQLEPLDVESSLHVVSSDVVSEVIVPDREEKSPIVTALMEVYKASKKLLRADIDGSANATDLRDLLNDKYDAFVKKHGTIGKNIGRLTKGAEDFFLLALEREDGSKADIFRRSITRKTRTTDGVTATDALLLCLDSVGKVDLNFISTRLDVPEVDAIQTLGESIFRDPISQEWQTAEQYLSGNVRVKLRQAQAAVEYDEQYKRNVTAMQSVIPATVEAGNIRAPIGAGWIPAQYIAQFGEVLMGGRDWSANYVEKLATWTVSCGYSYYMDKSMLTVKYGTSRINAYELLDHALNSKTPQIWDGSNDERVINTKETVAAQQKLADIKEEFERWLWSDADRSNDLVSIYNETYNAVRNAKYNGAHLSTPGLSEDISLRSNQKNAAWRVIQNPATIIAHEVGMGKTLTAIVAAMESKRLGFTRKAMIVVPNHTMSNWQIVLQTAYPAANLLLPGPNDLAKGNRSKFLSTVATNDWDIVLVPFSSFKLLPVSHERLRAFYTDQVTELQECLEEAKAEGAHGSRKEIEKSMKRLKVKLETLGDMKKDDTDSITWEELGIDMLIVDEFHAYKNLYFTTKMSRIAGLSNSDSQRAFDMFIKFRFAIEQVGKVVGMTGTPVTNTIAEMFTMQRFFQLERLREVGLANFDAWVRQFALAEPGLEMTPDGSGFRMNTRFRKFVNVPELMQLYLQVADAKRIDAEEIQRPDMWRGKPVKSVSYAGPELDEFVGTLAARAEKIRSGTVDPKDDNMLCVTSDGRKAALDLSLVIPAHSGVDMPKIDDMVEVVANIHRFTASVNGTQLIFCDLGTPKARAEKKKENDEGAVEIEDTDTEIEKALTTNVYGEINRRLIKHGIPEKDIAFIHSAKNPQQKRALEADVNKGKIRILLGSNEKMGTGLNLQERLVAVHQITPPWRPGDIEQQVGRMWRQGNRFPTVFQFVHVTEKSFDGYIWQLLENKAGFIAQIMSGSIEDREMEDIGDAVLTFTEIKGLASGNPKIMQKIIMDAELFRLNSIRASWLSSLYSLRNDIKYKNIVIKENQVFIDEMKKAIQVRDENKPEPFSLEVKEVFGDGNLTVVTEKDKAGQKLLLAAEQAAERVIKTAIEEVVIGRYRGHLIHATAVNLDFGHKPADANRMASIFIKVNGHKFHVNGADGAGVILSLNAIMRNFDDRLKKVEDETNSHLLNIASMEEELHKTWDHQPKYDKLALELEELNAELQDAKKSTEGERADERTEEEKEADIVAKATENKAVFEKAYAVKDVDEAYAAIEEMMSKPETLARFEIVEETPIPVEPESVFEAVQPIQTYDVVTAIVEEDEDDFPSLSWDDVKDAMQLALF